MTQEAVVHAYRHLLRHSLRAVRFSKPARYTIRDRMRLAFRKSPPSDFDSSKVANTLEFLHYAEKENGLEHKIVKNLLFVWYTQAKGPRSKARGRALTPDEIDIRTTVYDAFNHNIRMLNETMGMCLPAMTVRDPD